MSAGEFSPQRHQDTKDFNSFFGSSGLGVLVVTLFSCSRAGHLVRMFCLDGKRTKGFRVTRNGSLPKEPKAANLSVYRPVIRGMSAKEVF